MCAKCVKVNEHLCVKSDMKNNVHVNVNVVCIHRPIHRSSVRYTHVVCLCRRLEVLCAKALCQLAALGLAHLPDASKIRLVPHNNNWRPVVCNVVHNTHV